MHRYLQNNIWNFKTSISPWSRPRSASLFWAFFLGMVNIFILQKISPERDRLHLFCTFAVILGKFSAPTSSNFFSVENMGHNQLKKCRKYHLVSLLNEKQRSTFANFLHLFYPCPLLTNSAMCFWQNLAGFCIFQIMANNSVTRLSSPMCRE